MIVWNRIRLTRRLHVVEVDKLLNGPGSEKHASGAVLVILTLPD
jgi:hypothetical protein